MDTQQIIDALKEERVRLDHGIAVLEGSSRGSAVGGRRATTDPSATLSSSTDFPVFPVIQFPLLGSTNQVKTLRTV